MRIIWFGAIGLSFVIIMWALVPQSYFAQFTAADPTAGLHKEASAKWRTPRWWAEGVALGPASAKARPIIDCVGGEMRAMGFNCSPDGADWIDHRCQLTHGSGHRVEADWGFQSGTGNPGCHSEPMVPRRCCLLADGWPFLGPATRCILSTARPDAILFSRAKWQPAFTTRLQEIREQASEVGCLFALCAW